MNDNHMKPMTRVGLTVLLLAAAALVAPAVSASDIALPTGQGGIILCAGAIEAIEYDGCITDDDLCVDAFGFACIANDD
jgi:hypothetical protein